jgi:putative PIN family toxin of toxin-antitoxin system
VIPRVVFDTNTVISALLFGNGRLSWLRVHWRSGACTPIASRETISELARVLAYPKFRLSLDQRHELLADYLPFCEVVEVSNSAEVSCRDAADQKFLDLATSGQAHFLVTGDSDLLVLAGQFEFTIESPLHYASRFATQNSE